MKDEDMSNEFLADACEAFASHGTKHVEDRRAFREAARRLRRMEKMEAALHACETCITYYVVAARPTSTDLANLRAARHLARQSLDAEDDEVHECRTYESVYRCVECGRTRKSL